MGALLIKFLNTSFMEPIVLIFFLGGIARMIVVFFGIVTIKEIRKTKKIKNLEELEDVIFKSAKPAIHEEAHEIMSIKRYLETK